MFNSRNRKQLKRYSLILLALIISLLTAVLSKQEPDSYSEPLNTHKFREAEVLSVTDGDTFKVRSEDGSVEKVRLLLIDTPETKRANTSVQPFGPEASDYLTELLTGQTVQLESDMSERDQYGRILAYVYLGDKMVNELMLAEGLARVAVYPPDVKYEAQFRRIEEQAKSAKLGVWSIDHYVTERGFNSAAATAVPSSN
ncbi:thermonuclease family protein [Paenibacillus sp. MMS20-IR301]|uniref:thermonuclease family protein n=1 Tax=Paenibacillus sp. MMS20-IR301 TaxID=2895946 RepID=UPI0028E74F31|nr:thermonuclease family protein [Paenibacillus sp. MMS20-IR301]WNS45827.1 thermonuclease family protein [Paenibacillus sp. MMS20-IR301]